MGLTIGYPYYNSGKEFENIIKYYNGFHENLREQMKMIVVDDGSKDQAIDHNPGQAQFDLQIYKIFQDIYNNCPGANNLIMAVAGKNDIVIKMDIDFVLNEKDFLFLLNMNVGDNDVYFIFYDRMANTIIPHVNIFMIRNHVFWKTGGYDEDFSGQKGYSDVFQRWLYSYAGVNVVSDSIFQIQHIDAPSCGKNWDSSLRENERLYDKKRELLKNGEYIHGDVLRFDCKLQWRNV